ncbi:MAG: outer membrane lipoprotein carrier protein LolA [Bacteroidetes bacterium]|nr:MAG: outer membrane lipoprotein carrier protein LolA [Bacteroidota bacterium]
MHRLILLLALFGYLPAFTQYKPLDASTINRIKEGVAEAARTTNTISSDFTQEKEMTILKDRILTSGKFFFKKEQQLRWEYTHPFSYTIVIRDDEITIRDEGEVRSFNTQANRVFAEVNRIIIGSVRGTLLDDTGFKASYTQSNGNYIVRLTPLLVTLQESLQEIVIYFSKADFTVDKLELFEPAGDFTRITFSTKKLNQPLSNEIFSLY